MLILVDAPRGSTRRFAGVPHDEPHVRDEGALAQPDGEKFPRVEAQSAEDTQLEQDALASLEELLEMLGDAVDEDLRGALKRRANHVSRRQFRCVYVCLGGRGEGYQWEVCALAGALYPSPNIHPGNALSAGK